eukprot:TRINITY_DN4820_c1_g1_i2.p1 TRINITY_DN4820_c1_g1~~TRINITY_DN4820_c1_g1_i2.p1  ORF type:complete len:714 (+),score=348.75 TRINITY_DN4820_c1_g1_i2:87-2144(+)
MGKKVRKSSVPKAKVIDQSAVVAKPLKKKGKAPPAKGKFIAVGKQEDSDDDIAAAEIFDQDPAQKVKGLPKMDDDDDDDDEMMDDDFLGDAEENDEADSDAEEAEDDDDDFGVIDGDDSDEDDDDDESADDFEAKVAKEKLRLKQVQAEQAQEMALEGLTRPAKIFNKGEAEEDEEVVDEDGDAEGAAPGAGPQVTMQQREDRIQEVIRVLEAMSELREEEHSRDEYLKILRKDLVYVYEYSPWLMRKLADLFPPRELFEFLEVNEKQRPLTVRVNTLKTSRRDLAQAMTRKGMSVEPTGPWCKVGLQIFESDVAVGSTPEYLAGHYLVQSASSFLPVLAMDIEEGQRILDMAAAPGGKTTHIAQLLKNTGCLIANDVSAERLVALRGNVLRMGITNCIITNYNGVGMERVMNNFDRVLLDAPCTGVGVISRDPRIKSTKTERDVDICVNLQRKLILSAIDSLKVGGILCYSTCSILVEENEAAVDYAIRHRHIRVLPTGLPFGRSGMTKFREKRFHPSIEQSRRYYPHVFNMDGFYVCKIEKLAHGTNIDGSAEAIPEEKPKRKAKRKEPATTSTTGMPAPPAKLLKRREAQTAGSNGKGAAPAKAAEVVQLSVTEKDEDQVRSRWKRKKERDMARKKEEKKKAKKEKKASEKTEAAKPAAKPSSKKASAKKASAKKAPKKKSA